MGVPDGSQGEFRRIPADTGMRGHPLGRDGLDAAFGHGVRFADREVPEHPAPGPVAGDGVSGFDHHSHGHIPERHGETGRLGLLPGKDIFHSESHRRREKAETPR